MALIFLSGSIATANLSGLVEVNANYNHSWIKLGFACFLAIMWSCLAYKQTNKSNLS